MALKRSHGDDSATLCKHLVHIGPVTSEFKKGVCGISAATQLQFNDRHSFGTLAFVNGLKYYNFDISRLIGNHFCTLYRGFVIFS